MLWKFKTRLYDQNAGIQYITKANVEWIKVEVDIDIHIALQSWKVS